MAIAPASSRSRSRRLRTDLDRPARPARSAPRARRRDAAAAAEPPAPSPPPPSRRRAARRAPAPRRRRPSAEEAYNAGYRLWDQRRYRRGAGRARGRRHPLSRPAAGSAGSRNLQGRAYLDDDKPATAARILLANYQDNPRGERAADSLFYLGQALTRLNRRTEACRVYDELARVYPNMRDQLRRRLPQARPPRAALHRRS